MRFWKILLMIYIFCLLTQSNAQKIFSQEYIYSIKDSIELKAYVFTLDSLRNSENLPAIVIFHGGGWSNGEAAWSFGRAEHFAKLGFVAIAAQYRLPDQKNITPFEAMEDARDIIKWIRLNKIEMHKLSPDENVKKGLPPTLILQGRDDTVTPLSGVQNFTNKMILNGNICELIIYDGVGHLFTTSNQPDDGFPNPDPKVQANAFKKADEFLRSLGYID